VLSGTARNKHRIADGARKEVLTVNCALNTDTTCGEESQCSVKRTCLSPYRIQSSVKVVRDGSHNVGVNEFRQESAGDAEQNSKSEEVEVSLSIQNGDQSKESFERFVY